MSLGSPTLHFISSNTSWISDFFTKTLISLSYGSDSMGLTVS